VVLAAVVGASVLSACGGGSADRLSRRALTREAERICAAGQAEADRLRAEAQADARGADAATEIDATLEALDTQIQGFEDLRGPAGTDDALATLVRHLRAAAAGLGELRDVAVADDLTVDEAIRSNPDIVEAVNRSSAQAADDLVALGWLTCVGVAEPGG